MSQTPIHCIVNGIVLAPTCNHSGIHSYKTVLAHLLTFKSGLLSRYLLTKTMVMEITLRWRELRRSFSCRGLFSISTFLHAKTPQVIVHTYQYAVTTDAIFIHCEAKSLIELVLAEFVGRLLGLGEDAILVIPDFPRTWRSATCFVWLLICTICTECGHCSGYTKLQCELHQWSTR